MTNNLVSVLVLLNQLLTTGIAITAFSLLLYALTFNLQDRIARSFAFILACMTLVFTADTVSSIISYTDLLSFLLRLQWVGIICLPAAYFYSSDALLATTGRPSRGRRRLVIKISLIISLTFLLLLPTQFLVGRVKQSLDAAPYLERTWLTWIFTGYYACMMLWSWANFWRAFRRTKTSVGRRRLIYLMAGATAPAIGSFPFLLFGEGIAQNHHLLFWLTVITLNIGSLLLVIMMAYAVAFFGVDWPDRIIKSRLFRWLFRGPVTAILVLAITTLVRVLGKKYGGPYQTIEIVLIIGTILVMQYIITLISPWIERKLFFSGDYETVKTLQEMQQRILTASDLVQFLEAALAAACDRLQSPHGFLATLNAEGMEIMVTIGTPQNLQDLTSESIFEIVNNDDHNRLSAWGNYWIVPLKSNATNGKDERQEGNLAQSQQVLGVIGIAKVKENEEAATLTYNNDLQSLAVLAARASLALESQSAQQKLFNAFEDIAPQVGLIQHLRAASRYEGSQVLIAPLPVESKTSAKDVKDALNHYWGGPKLVQSPLLKLTLVRNSLNDGETPPNVLRNVLRQAIEKTRPSTERRYTSEWILYNILEMKFIEGHKVKDISARLAISEADFYRKQRAAIKIVTNILQSMERQILLENLNNKEKGLL
jgi:hypothetical protein